MAHHDDTPDPCACHADDPRVPVLGVALLLALVCGGVYGLAAWLW